MNLSDYLKPEDIFQSIEDAAVVLDDAWRYLYINNNALPFFNKTREEAIGKTLWEVFPEMKNTAVALKYQTVMEQKVPVSFEMHWYDNRWLRVRAFPLQKGISIFATDITKEKRAISEFEEISEHFKLYTEVNSNGLFYLDHKGKFQYVNEKLQELTGLSSAEILSNTLTQILFSQDKKKQEDVEKLLIQQDTINDICDVHNSTNDTRIQIHVQAIPINVKGIPKGYIGSIKDITENIKAHKIIEESENWFRNASNNAPVMIWSTDANKRTSYLNNTWLEFTGRTIDPESGMGWLERIHPEDQKRMLKLYNEAFEQRRNFKAEFRLQYHGGGYRWVSAVGKPLYTPDNAFLGFIGSCADIDEKVNVYQDLDNKIKERTKELNEALERERELNMTKSHFVSIASHEFRTPLSTILSSTGLISTYLTLNQPENIQKHLDRIKGSVKHLTDILGDFLSVEKLEQGLVKVDYSIFNLHQFIYEIKEELEGMLKAGQEIICILRGESLVQSDKKILHNILNNLLSNAIKYSDQEVTLKAEVHENHIYLSVADKGIGIPKEEQEQLFKKYYRASNVGSIKGTGLGLNIVQRYVELLNGEISFESSDKGTTFSITIPKESNIENVARRNYNISAI
ncbi:MAG: PAS domain-containing sensor histidine kinase [Bacteroidetes bacterium]|nr:PAS domain-containing sensor histidine kinase [Bacteroidota bacterium]